MDGRITHPRQVTPVVVQRTTSVDQYQVTNPKYSISTSPMRSGRDGYSECVGAGSKFHALGTNLRKGRGHNRLIGQRL